MIQEAAIVCRFCGRDVSLSAQTPIQPRPPTSKPMQKGGTNPAGILLVVILGVIAVLWFLGQLGGTISTPSLFPGLSAPTTTHRIKYKITGTASRASLTYQNEQGGSEQTEINIPWAIPSPIFGKALRNPISGG